MNSYNAKISVYVIFVDVIIYLLLYNLHDCTLMENFIFRAFQRVTTKQTLNVWCSTTSLLIAKKTCLVHTFGRSYHGIVTKVMFGFKNIKNMLCLCWKWGKLKKYSVHQICENMDFHWPVFSRIKTESAILSIYGRIQVSENPYSRIFYPVIGWRGSFNSELQKNVWDKWNIFLVVSVSLFLSFWINVSLV